MRKKLAALALVVAAVSSSCARPSDEARASAAADAAAVVYKVPLDDSPSAGDARAPVTLVAFSDYECPFCVRGDAIVTQLRKAYGSKLRFVMRQMPLAIHPHARAAAAAALAAGQQGKFWPMHERLFASSRSLDEDTITRIAVELGLDVIRWNADRARMAATVDRDQAVGASLGVQGTPTFFVNGRKIAGAQSLDTFRPILDEEVEKATALIAKGTRAEDVYAALTKDGLEKAPAPAKAPGASAPGARVAAAADPTAKPACDDPGGDCGCKGDQEPEDTGVLESIDVGASPVRGAASAPVTITVFSDFECPFCKRGEGILRTVEETYGTRVRVVWKNLPLPMHASARIAAKAAVAAGQQGKFWEYHDALFAHQSALDPASLERYAQDLGLDVARFRAALADKATDAIVDADEAQASRLGVNGTPTFFVNGRRLNGAQPLSAFQPRIEAALADPR